MAAGRTAGGVSVRPDEDAASELSLEAELAFPEVGPPPVTVVPDGEGRWAVVVQPSSSVGELAAALGGLPEGARFEAAYGDVKVMLAYEYGGRQQPGKQVCWRIDEPDRQDG
jgi:uncharacterized repeat protein (TIGR03917 family)